MRHTLVRSLAISGAIIAGWICLGSFYWTQDLLIIRMRALDVPIVEVGLQVAIVTVVWMVLTPVMLYVTQFVPLGPGRWAKTIPIVMLLIFAFAAIRVMGGLALVPVIEDRGVTSNDFIQAFSGRFHANVTLGGIVIVTRLLWDFARNLREREHRALALEGQLTRAQLEQLKGQLHPHFLFNALNGIATLLHTDPRRADRMLMELSALLRATLEMGTEDLIPLEQEMSLINRYLNIQQMRFEDRLTIERRIGPDTLPLLVPPFILQPLVENSLQHVVARLPRGGHVTISSAREDAVLRLRVEDDGPGFDPRSVRYGVGITNVKERLEQLFGSRAELAYRREGQRFVAEICIPEEAH